MVSQGESQRGKEPMGSLCETISWTGKRGAQHAALGDLATGLDRE